MTCETRIFFSIGFVHMIHLMAMSHSALSSLASGLALREGDGINCDETETVGSEIQRSLDSGSVRKATIIKEASDGAHSE